MPKAGIRLSSSYRIKPLLNLLARVYLQSLKHYDNAINKFVEVIPCLKTISLKY